MRLSKVNELNLLLTIQHEVWGSKRDAFKKWKAGDEIAFVVDKSLAALAEVSGKHFRAKDPLWPDAEYPFRIPLHFKTLILAPNRPPLLGEVREALMAEYGAKWGFAMINQTPIPDRAADAIRRSFSQAHNDLKEGRASIETLLQMAKIGQEIRGSIVSPRVSAPSQPSDFAEGDEDRSDAADESLHTRTQHALIELGRAAKCAIWVASNDRRRSFNGKTLGENCMTTLPPMGLSKEAMDRIALIDVLWLQQNAPAFAFEVEVSTTIYSGLLRMADLLALVPNLKLSLFIVAPAARRQKVMAQLARPTFRRIGLSDYCRFVPIESVEALLAKSEGFRGFLHSGIIETIAEECEIDVSEQTA